MTGTYTVGGKSVSLTQSDYKAAGGEGVIYVKGSNAYKIYHDPVKMIAAGKIQELSVLAPLANVLGPTDVIYKTNNPVGFVMKYMKDTEFLCKLFTKGYRVKNNIAQPTINGLVKILQDTTEKIHGHKILLVDANEMNFLVSPRFDNVYFIDVDSYKTTSYPATALMESVRDRKVKGNNFTENSDWFSMGITMFQLYVGCHPYKGRHPDFAAKDWPTMMDKGISIFNHKCNLPPATQDLNVIPKGHLRWFEAIFEKGDRLPPPQADATAPVGPVVAKIVQGNDKFNITVEYAYDMSKVVAARFIDGICHAITEKAIWANGKLLTHLTPTSGYTAQRTIQDLCPVQGDKPVLLEWNRIDAKLVYKTFDNVSVKQIGEIESNGFFVANRCAYTVVRDSLIELSFINTGVKTTPLQQSVANIFHNHTIYDGVVIQNMLGTCRFAIPYMAGRCSVLRVKELDGTRIVDAKYDSGICIVIAERHGKYERHTLIFDKECRTYNARVEQDVELCDINFGVKDNDVVIAENGEKLEIFLDNSKIKLVDSPLNGNQKILTFKNDTYVVSETAICKITSK